jgi:hypothetical protein
MKTSYFARLNSNNFKGRDLNGVSVARSSRYWSGRKYPPLFPTWEMIKIENQQEYEEVYRNQILDQLDPLKVYNDLGEDAILLCHESEAKINSGEEFCHRHMIANWLEEELLKQYNIDIVIPELLDDKADLKKILKQTKMKIK